MRINRAIGLVLFIIMAHLIVGNVVTAVSGAIVASMQTLETASQTATIQMIKASSTK